jgi:myosin heavy subunit
MSNNKNFYWIFKNNKWLKSNQKSYSIFYLGNTEEESDLENLIDLVHLNEPSILYSSLIRYQKDKIYTFTGNILLAINPFKKINIYDNLFINKYKNGSNEPHPYFIANSCINNLFRNNKNQVVLVSGESGAGKTVTTKFIMKYISEVSNKNVTNLENKILASNPIIEAFGNAKTLRNDNSSRFGKFIKLLFKGKELVGARIDSYLLEKIRLTSLSDGERNFHIFYLLLKCHPKYKDEISKYNFLNKSDISIREDNITDEEMYEELIQSFKDLNFSEDEIEDIFNFTYFILVLGNNINNDLYEKLNLDKNILIDYLEINNIKVGNEIIEKKRSKEEKKVVLDTICQNLYLLLFNYIIEKINENINSDYDNYIGILDIFGFEVFKKNNFEQLCINYTNERLQNIFNKFIFELEQKEYKKEGIEWEEIQYGSNNNIINLIDNKNMSIFSYLIEQSILGSGNDRSFYQNIQNNLINNNSFEIDNKNRVKNKYTIIHYAGNVTYESSGYVNKNRNNVDMRLKEFLKKSSNKLIKNLNLSIFSFISKKIKNKNIIYQFKGQLDKLINELSKQEQHYIRCIKPNDLNICNNFDEDRVLEQLKYCGVLEAIKIARLGYPVRFKKDIFFDKYYSLFRKYNYNISDINNLFSKYNFSKNLYKVGLTKIFLKKELNNDIMSKFNLLRVNKSICLQKNFRKFYFHKKYKLILKFIIWCQYNFKKSFKKKVQSITKITSFFRRCKYRIEYLKVKKNVVKIQKVYKQYKFYKKNKVINNLLKVLNIQYKRFYFNKLNSIIHEKIAINKIIIFYKKNKKRKELCSKVSLLEELENLKLKIKEKEEENEELKNTIYQQNNNYNKIIDNLEKNKLESENSEEVHWREKYERIKEDYFVYKKEMRDYMEEFKVVEKKESGQQCNIIDRSDLSVLKYENDSLKEENQRIKSKNCMIRVDLSNKNKIILNLSNKIDELLKFEDYAKDRMKLYEQDQERLGDKIMNLYLKIDYYKDMLKKKKRKLNLFIK